MRVVQECWVGGGGWRRLDAVPDGFAPQLVLAFGARPVLDDPGALGELRQHWPGTPVVGCSTAGEICGTRVNDDTLTATVIQFDRTAVRVAYEPVASPAGARDAGGRLAGALGGPDLRHVFVLSEGLRTNGSALAEGLALAVPSSVSVTGGLSADASRFARTLLVDGAAVRDSGIVGIGFYGDALRIGFGSRGGWEPFGPLRVITRSRDNVLLELDGESALSLYRRYLGPDADALPASGLLFPLSVQRPGSNQPVVRTLLGIDEDAGAMVFAGDVPEGAQARLMRARLDSLVDGATRAAADCRAGGTGETELALLVSCVGRKLVLRQRIEEEVEGVSSQLGERARLTGFYSYGELSAFDATSSCQLHNQTMTITTLSEAA
jgi:hypothetical protein